jgi:plastocyanin
VPLLTREMRRVYPFLSEDFAPTGVLAGKEVYAFLPSTIVVVEGDTVAFDFLNPEDDVHSFVLPDLVVPLPPESRTSATYVARKAGIYDFTCSVASHLPSMWGQLIVLSPAAVAPGAEPSGTLIGKDPAAR